MLQSEDMLFYIITEIQKNLEILFEISYWISLVDMMVSFVSFVKSYPTIEFCRTKFIHEEKLKI